MKLGLFTAVSDDVSPEARIESLREWPRTKVLQIGAGAGLAGGIWTSLIVQRCGRCAANT